MAAVLKTSAHAWFCGHENARCRCGAGRLEEDMP
jgi:hypothetical protein